MNKLIPFVTLLCVCFISCTDTSSTSATTSTVDSQSVKNRANSKEAYRAMETGDVSKLDSFIDKDIVDHEGNMHGLDTLKKMFSSMHNSIKDLKMETIANATDGDYNFAYVRMTGTTTDASMGMPANTKVDRTFVDVVKMRDGKAVEHWGYSDMNEMMKMMNTGKGMPPMENKMNRDMDNKMKDTMKK
jgi:predicted ester cyclase